MLLGALEGQCQPSFMCGRFIPRTRSVFCLSRSIAQDFVAAVMDQRKTSPLGSEAYIAHADDESAKSLMHIN